MKSYFGYPFLLLFKFFSPLVSVVEIKVEKHVTRLVKKKSDSRKYIVNMTKGKLCSFFFLSVFFSVDGKCHDKGYFTIFSFYFSSIFVRTPCELNWKSRSNRELRTKPSSDGDRHREKKTKALDESDRK